MKAMCRKKVSLEVNYLVVCSWFLIFLDMYSMHMLHSSATPESSSTYEKIISNWYQHIPIRTNLCHM
jgi:flagellar basal body-associated protein FliL